MQEALSPFLRLLRCGVLVWIVSFAWELFHRLNREEADRYLENRARKGFTVIQAVALAELDGVGVPNAYGHWPLLNNDPTQPDVKEGSANDYWDHVDYVVEKANALGLNIGFLPTWGDKWNKKRGAGGASFTAETAAIYGRWLGQRYKDKGIIWILGGDRPVETDQQRDIIRALAGGLSEGDGGGHLKTFHPPGGNGSSAWWQNDEWLDFHMRQNGHGIEFTGRYDQTRADYDRRPFDNKGEREFVPPNPGELLDWVLVLDDEAKGYPMPGEGPHQP